MPPRSLRLPPELVDLILDQLINDKKALAICSLVCRSWLPRTHMHLFHSITLGTVAKYTKLEKFLKTSPDMAHYIHKLHITKWRAGATSVDRELPRILQKLPKVERLMVTKWAARSMSDGVRANLSAFLMNVKHLSLSHHSIYKPDFLRLIRACSHLFSLSVISMTLISFDPPAPNGEGRIDSVEMDTFRGSWGWNVVADCLLELPLGVRIRRLDISMSLMDSPSTLQNLLNACGSHLEHLTLSFEWRSFPDDPAWRQLSLTSNPRLRSLSIDYAMHSLSCRHTFIEVMPHFLSLIQPLHTSLQQVRITVSPSDIMTIPCVPFEQVDDALSRIAPAHSNLVVIFEALSSPASASSFPETWFQNAVDVIHGYLPKVCAGPMRLGIVYAAKCAPEYGVIGTPMIKGVRERWFPS